MLLGLMFSLGDFLPVFFFVDAFSVSDRPSGACPQKKKTSVKVDSC
jgi:hypothetical protein